MARFTMRYALVSGFALCGISSLATAQGTKAKADTVVPMHARAYEGQFRPMQQAQGGVGLGTQQRIYGSVKIAFRESSDRSKVNITINTTLQQSEILGWSTNPGQCGGGSVPFMPVAQFPGIEVGSTGRGEVDANIQLSIPSSGAVHVNVYRGGDTLDKVIACANLRMK